MEVLNKVLFSEVQGSRESLQFLRSRIYDLFEDKYKKVIFLKNETIIKEGKSNDFVYFVESGKVILTRKDLSGREYCNGYILPGEFFGYSSAYTNKPEIMNYKALSNCSTSVIKFSDIQDEIQKNPELRKEVNDLLINTVRNLTLRQGNLIMGDCRTTFVNFIMEHVREFGKLDENKTLTVSLDINLAEIAVILNMTRETLSRIVSEMKKDGIIDTRRRYIKIIDLERFVS